MYTAAALGGLIALLAKEKELSRNKFFKAFNEFANIENIKTSTIKLHGLFTGDVKLSCWNVSIKSKDWILYRTDSVSKDGWSWNFNFPNGPGVYRFYSIGKRVGWSNEDIPSVYDEICFYEPIGG